MKLSLGCGEDVEAGDGVPIFQGVAEGLCIRMLRKIGSHAYALIDHIFYNPGKLMHQEHVSCLHAAS